MSSPALVLNTLDRCLAGLDWNPRNGTGRTWGPQSDLCVTSSSVKLQWINPDACEGRAAVETSSSFCPHCLWLSLLAWQIKLRSLRSSSVWHPEQRAGPRATVVALIVLLELPEVTRRHPPLTPPTKPALKGSWICLSKQRGRTCCSLSSSSSCQVDSDLLAQLGKIHVFTGP